LRVVDTAVGDDGRDGEADVAMDALGGVEDGIAHSGGVGLATRGVRWQNKSLPELAKF
jgi:hypothetical protein